MESSNPLLSDTEQQPSGRIILRPVPEVMKIHHKLRSNYLQSDGFVPGNGAKTDGDKNFHLPVMFFVHEMVPCSERY